MTCMSHKWFFGAPCPRCAAAAKPMEKTDVHQRDNASAGHSIDSRDRTWSGFSVLDKHPPVEKLDGPELPSPVRVLGVPSAVRDDLSYVEPPLPVERDDGWDIPAYLLRRQGGGFMYPSLHGEKHALVHNADTDGHPVGVHRVHSDNRNTTALKFWPDAQLLTALSDHTISGVDRQPILEEAKKRHDQVKGYERNKPFL